MAKGKVINFPAKPTEPTKADEAGATWGLFVAKCFRDSYSFEYHPEKKYWSIAVKSDTILGALAVAEQCRRELGWGPQLYASEVRI